MTKRVGDKAEAAEEEEEERGGTELKQKLKDRMTPQANFFLT